MTGEERRARLAAARLYVCTPLRPDLDAFLDAILRAGVDVVQLRDKDAGVTTLLEAASVFRAAADRYGALFIVNDRADVAAAARADGVHVGQDDLPPAAARDVCGPQMLIGRSTHTREELLRAHDEPVDYAGVGPVHATPTKPGRPGVGIDHLRFAAADARLPWFVTGGMDERSIPEARAAGATRFVVVRAITEAPDPAAAVARIRSVIDA